MRSSIKTNIIPSKIQFAKIEAPKKLHLEAICVFTAIGFFLDQDTYWNNKIVLRPASNNYFDKNNRLINSQPYFNWHYSPRDISFETALEEFTHLFDVIVAEQTKNKKVILPLSGGLDSRTQAAALKERADDV